MSLLPQTSLDRRLLRSAAKYETPEQMSERVLGQLTPAQCIDRVKTLLASRTILDEVEERRMLLISMAEHLDWLRDQRENPKSWNAIGRAYKLLSDQIERANINVNDISTKLAEDHAAIFVSGISLGIEAALREVARNPQRLAEQGENVARRVRAEYSWRRTAERALSACRKANEK